MLSRLLVLTLLILPLHVGVSVLQADPPAPQLVLPCSVVDVYDGDTVTVELKLQVRVRLLNCWAAELKTQDIAEKESGVAAADYLKALATGCEGTLIIPLSPRSRLDDLFTFGRVLGDVQLQNEPDPLSKQMVRSGHAFATKEELLEHLHRH